MASLLFNDDWKYSLGLKENNMDLELLTVKVRMLSKSIQQRVYLKVRFKA